MEKELVEGKLGSVGQYDVEFKEGKLIAQVTANVPVGEAGLVVKIDAGAVMDAVAKAIPGQIDDAVIAMIKGALLKA